MNITDLEIVVLIGLSILVGGAISSKTKVAEPIVLLAIGASLGFVPGIGDIALPPSVVLYLFLPALLYWESLNTSFREIRANSRAISMLATGLVLLTAAVVAVVAHTFGVSWTYSIVIGAILAPTDATAVASVAGRMPRRMLAILRGESLINDGTALVLYSVAVAAILADKEINGGEAVLLFIGSYIGGALIGAAVALLVLCVRRKIGNPLLTNSLSVLTPFLAFLPAQYLGISGVIAVVTCGLVLSQLDSKNVSATARIQVSSFWALTAHLLNGALFVLVGLQLHTIWDFSMSDAAMVLEFGLSCTVAVIGVRWVWIHTAPYLRGLFSNVNDRTTRRVRGRQRTPLAWAGFRGAVSLAAALALPIVTTSGKALPERPILIAVTFIVIVLTLLIQGLTMPMIVRRAQLEEDPAESDERILASTVPLETALDSLSEVSDRLGLPLETQANMRADYQKRLGRIRSQNPGTIPGRAADTSDDAVSEQKEAVLQETQLQLALIPVKRAALMRLRSQHKIDDAVLRSEETNIDIEEIRLAGFAQEP
ncbi:MAG: Na+/H+ antiporter [Subtercola sp.]|nr:Na+/H+ antiporter [Subtercola sp.]